LSSGNTIAVEQEAPEIRWPCHHEIFGVQVSETTYDQAQAVILEAARRRVSAVVTHLPVHGVVTAVRDRKFREQVNTFDIVAPDGQPVRWALNRFRGTQLPDRVYGPKLMLRLCQGAPAQGISIYLYGSTPEVVERLRENLIAHFPQLKIAGCESPPFRELSAEEVDAVVDRFNESGAGLIFLGLGCPRQDMFAYALRGRVQGVLLCVGAAFDFIAGTKSMAPRWMQNHGLEWLFRLAQEPRRLLRRYAVTNTIFIMLTAREMLRFRPAEGMGK